MAGTQQLVEVSPDLIAQTLLTIASDEKNSVEGIDISGLQNGATCYVRVLDRVYRYYQFSVVAVAPPTVIAPAAGLAFGRWILQPGSGSTVVGGCPTVYTVAPDGSGTYPTVELAIAAANTNATAALPITVAVCPGQYLIATTLDITNSHVDFIGEAETASYLLCAAGITPLLRISAVFNPLEPDVTRVSNLVFQRGDVGTLLETTGDTTSLFGNCIFLSSALAFSVLIDALAGSGQVSVFTECNVIDAGVGVTGLRGAGNVAFSDGNLSGEPALDVRAGAVVQVRRSSAFTFGAHAVRVTDEANLEWIEGEIGVSGVGPGIGVECVGTGPLVQLDQVRIVSASTGIQTPTDGLETGMVRLAHVVYAPTNETDTFLRIGSAYKARMLDCTCNDSAVPFDRTDTAELGIEWGNINVSLGLDDGGPQFVRWVTSEQDEGRTSIDTHRENPDGYLQLRLRDAYTPPSSTDTNGGTGTIAWDKNFVYVKTSTGPDVWKRAWMETFPAGPSPISGGPGFAQGFYVGTGILLSQVIPVGPPFPFDPANVHLSFDTGGFVGGTVDANRSMPPGSATFFSFLVALFLPDLVFPLPAITFGPGSFTVGSLANLVGVTYYWTVTA